MSLAAILALSLMIAPPAPAPAVGAAPPAASTPAAAPPIPGPISDAVTKGIDILLARQEGESKSEWPYEGVYRVNGVIPIGYRVGGTSICAEALLIAPGYEKDPRRQEAVKRACDFVCQGTSQPLMSVRDYRAGYDVRGWGYCYGARFLMALRAANAIPAGMESRVDDAMRWYVDAMQKTEIPEVGGWNYARSAGVETPCAASVFMTAPCLQVLFEARRQGLIVDNAVVERGLAALQRCRNAGGNFAYASQKQTRESDASLPGAIGRMVSGEAVLFRAGRSDVSKVTFALDKFLENWEELEKRRKQNGTHAPPYNVAPYYFYFAFHHAADAVELLPEPARQSYREKINELLFKVREDDGGWNDRVFPRSEGYGTAMVMMGMLRPWAAPPATWKSPPKDDPAPQAP